MARDQRNKARDVTDTKLRDERSRADEELLERSGTVGETANEVVQRARQRARLVLELARGREDRALDSDDAGADTRNRVATERELADQILDREYTEADATLFDEESQRRRAILQLLALDRVETDRMLASERRISDHTLTARDDMLGVVSHDLRSHLSTVLLRTATLLAGHSDDVPLVTNVVAIQRSVAQMDKLVSDLLDLAMMEAGRLRIDRAAMDLASVVADEVSVHRLAAEARSIDLVLEMQHDPIIVEIDPARMSRALMNVLTNAIKFTPEGGRIEVSVEREAREACIRVKDTGPGIPADKLAVVFERFNRIEGHVHGHGLGLYIARTIVNAHNGRIWVESKPGEGSTFRICLPAVPQP